MDRPGPIIKICGNRFADDSFFIASLKPDVMGWIFSPFSPRRIPVEEASRLIRRIHRENPEIIHAGVFAGNTVKEIIQIVRFIPGMDLVQIADGPGFLQHLSLQWEPAFPTILPALRVREPLSKIEHIKYGAAGLFVLDSFVPGKPGGTGKTFDLNFINDFSRPFLIAGGLNEKNVVQVLSESNASGVDVSSGIEDGMPGKKSAIRAKQFVESVRLMGTFSNGPVRKTSRFRRREFFRMIRRGEV